jgi:hypothetical protein
LLNIEGFQLFVASAEDILIAKLEWAKLSRSQRQIEDAAGILKIQSDSLDRSYLDKWISELSLQQEWKNALHAADSSVI